MITHPHITNLANIVDWEIIPFIVTERATGRIVAANNGLARLTGFSVGTLLALNVVDLGPWTSLESRAETLAKTPSSMPGLLSVLRTAAGSDIPIAHGWQTVTGEEGELIYEVFVDMSFASEARRNLERMSRFREVLAEVLRESLARGHDDGFYQRVLLSAVQTIPNAQTASLLVRDEDGLFRFRAAVKCDFEELRDVSFTESQMHLGSDGLPFLHYGYSENRDLPAPLRAALNASGPTERIKVTIVSPVQLDGRTVAVFNLDNLESPDAFDAEALSMARDYAQHIAVLLQRFQYEAALERQANTDQLTGLPNRRSFDASLAAEFAVPPAPGTDSAIFYIDLDNFKSINDFHGHSFGDTFIQAVSQRLLRQLPGGSVLSRWGGDELVAFVPDMNSPRQAALFAEALLTAARRPYEIEGLELMETISIGVALRSDADNDAGQVLRNADLALYAAKREGRNTFRLFDDQLRAVSRLRAELRQAVASERIELHYMPRWSLDGRLVAFEGLARWNHPERGLLLARDFLPEAAEAGLLKQLSTQLLHLACRQAREWLDAGHSLPVAFNLGSHHLASATVVEDVRTALRRHAVPGHLLELQFTETAALADLRDASQKLAELRLLGVTLLLDGIGSGFSHLAVLRRFNLDAIRIKRGFVMSLGEPGSGVDDHATRDVIHALISLGAELGVRVVAEGVETEGQAEFLRSAGVAEMQGYLFSEALTPGEVAALLRDLD